MLVLFLTTPFLGFLFSYFETSGVLHFWEGSSKNTPLVLFGGGYEKFVWLSIRLHHHFTLNLIDNSKHNNSIIDMVNFNWNQNKKRTQFKNILRLSYEEGDFPNRLGKIRWAWWSWEYTIPKNIGRVGGVNSNSMICQIGFGGLRQLPKSDNAKSKGKGIKDDVHSHLEIHRVGLNRLRQVQ